MSSRPLTFSSITTPRTSPLLRTPLEILKLTAECLDPVDLHNLNLSCKALRIMLPSAPRLSRIDRIRFNKNYEATYPRGKLCHTLFCATCMTLHPTSKFADSQASRKCQGDRICIVCGIKTGKYKKLSITVNKKKRFGCSGCKKALPLDDEETGREIFEFRSSIGYGRDVRVTLDTKLRRWCKACWDVARTMLGDHTDTVVKMQQVWGAGG